MNAFTNLLILACALFWQRASTAPVKQHESAGQEHIVIINRSHPTPPRVEEVLNRLALHDKHPHVRHIYNNSAFHGFAASLLPHRRDQLVQMTDILLVEAARNVRQTEYDTRSNAPWGLQRISTAAKVSGNVADLDFTYSFANSSLGSGADIYMIDTGIYTANNIFGGRAKMLWSMDGIMTDNDGHGTHTAGTAGGNILGVASGANIWGLKALDNDGGGWSSDIVGAIDVVMRTHDVRKWSAYPFLGSVMSMSLASGGNVESINQAIRAATSSGVHAVVAAGNDGDDACLASPASSGGTHGPAITVGSVDVNAQKSSFSNYGECVDLYAPGEGVISAWVGGPNMINSLSGTSMATPHVTGIVAYAMVNATLAANPELMKEWVRMTALPMDNGILLANNGVQPDAIADGMLGFQRTVAKPDLIDAKVERRPWTACRE